MKEQLKAFTRLCTRSLSGDPALRLEIGRELETHLEDAYDEERCDGKTETEAEEFAKKRFGEPEELAQSLLDANRYRFWKTGNAGDGEWPAFCSFSPSYSEEYSCGN